MKCLSEMVHMKITLCGIYSNDFTVTSKQTKLLDSFKPGVTGLCWDSICAPLLKHGHDRFHVVLFWRD